MWKIALISLAALLSAAQAWEPTYPRVRPQAYGQPAGTGVKSWDILLAELMQNNVNTGVCAGRCYVEIGGRLEILERGGEPVTFPEEPCVSYTCPPRSGDVIREEIKCRDDSEILKECDGGAKLIYYPEACCKQCEAPDTPPGEFEEWAEWTECSVTCGGGRRARRRRCRVTEDDTLVDCVGRLSEAEDCNNDPCPIGCVWEWGEYGQCSRTCGRGVQERFPIITQQPQHGGMPCPPNVRNEVPEERQCFIRDCPTDCEWEWTPFTQCTVTCGGGTRTRRPRITTPATNGGSCPQRVIDEVPETETCNPNNCPVDCVWEWSGYSPCPVTCGGGTRTRQPEIITPPMFNGNCDLPEVESQPCATNDCPVDCEWEWERFSDCSVTCGKGIRTRRPRITQQARNGGTCNLPSEETRDCDLGECPEVCGPNENFCPEEGGCVPDRDRDCVPDERDNCIDTYNPDQRDSESDGPDGVGDACDNCRALQNTDQIDTDRDGSGDECDLDDDDDGIVDSRDNCPLVASSNTNDRDGDRVGDICDNCRDDINSNQRDRDGDGVGDVCDNCRGVANPGQEDSDGNGRGDACPRVSQMGYDYDDYDDDEAALNEADKKNLAVQIMEKLLELYYSS